MAVARAKKPSVTICCSLSGWLQERHFHGRRRRRENFGYSRFLPAFFLPACPGAVAVAKCGGDLQSYPPTKRLRKDEEADAASRLPSPHNGLEPNLSRNENSHKESGDQLETVFGSPREMSENGYHWTALLFHKSMFT